MIDPIALDASIVLFEVLIWLAFMGILYFLTDLTFKELAQWFQSKTKFNPMGLAKGVFTKGFQIILISGLALIFIINAYLFQTGQSISEYMQELVLGVPEEQWNNLALGFFKSILLLLLVTLVLTSFHPWLRKMGDRLKDWQQIVVNNRSIDNFLWAIETTVSTSLWLLTLLVCLEFLFFPDIVTDYLYIGLECYLVLCFGVICIYGVIVLMRSLDALSDVYLKEYPKSFLRFYHRFRHLLSFTEKCLAASVYVVIAGFILDKLIIFQAIAPYTISINKIILVILGAAYCIELSNILIDSLFFSSDNLNPFQLRRRMTFVPLLKNTVRYGIYFGAGIIFLYIINVDPTPILAGAGIVGIAVGLGAQNLINDLVNGFTILLQNYYLVGDFVETNTAAGIVEDMDLRVTRIRSPDGRLHIIRNGDITTLVNYSKDFVYAVVQVGVDYDSNLDDVYRVLGEVGKKALQMHPDVIEATRIDGLENFAESELTIRTSTKVKPGKHLAVQRLVRKLIKEAFDREQIEIPFARRVLIMKNEAEAEGSEQLFPEGSEVIPSESGDGQL